MIHRDAVLTVVCLSVACGEPSAAPGDGGLDPGPRPPSCGHEGVVATPLPVAQEMRVTHPEVRVSFDSTGSLILPSISRGTEESPYCAALTKRDAEGNIVWRRAFNDRYPPAEPGGHCPHSWEEIAVDRDDNIVAIGAVGYGEWYDPDWTTLMVRAFDAEGRLAWTAYDEESTAPVYERPHDVAFEPGGGVLAAGSADGPWVASYAADGTLRWIWRDPGATSEFVAVESDPSGNAIVAHMEFDGPGRLLRIDPEGAESQLADIPAGIVSEVQYRAAALAVDADGAAAVLVDRDHPRLWKIASDGSLEWEADIGELGVSERGCRIVTKPGGFAIAAAPDRSLLVAFMGDIDLEYQPDGDEIPPLDPDVTGLARFSRDGELLEVHLDWEDAGIDDIAVAPDGTLAIRLGYNPRVVRVPPPADR